MSRYTLLSSSYTQLGVAPICIVILNTIFPLGLDTYSIQGMASLAISRVGLRRVFSHDSYLE